MERDYDLVRANEQIPLGRRYEKLEDAFAARKAGEEQYFRPRQELVNAIKNNVR